MNQYQVRCPSCSKLYAIERKHMQAIRDGKAAPCVQCAQCPVVFSFEVPVDLEQTTLDAQVWTPDIEFNEALTAALDESVPAVLRNQWLTVIERFPEEKIHFQFLADCKQAGQLEFALRRYKKLGQVLGNDPLCSKMQDILLQMMKPVVTQKSQLKSEFWVHFDQIKSFIPFVFGGTMILGGLLNSAHRNMIGFGIVVCIIGYLFPRRESSS